MKKLLVIGTIVLAIMMFGCPSDQADSQRIQPSSDNGNKITSLQSVIDSSDIKDGSEIDLSKYPDIKNYNATINKAVIIKDNKTKNLEGATLEVVTDGVKLDGIKGASVTTQSSLRISGSSLSSLSISSVSSANASQISRSGTSATLSGRKSTQPLVVEVDNTEVAEDVSVGIANAYLNVKQFTAKKAIELGAANVQLTINDKETNIKEIKTDKICQVILEDGTSDTIPCSLDKISVTGSGELKQIDMTAKDSKRLIALTPVGGLTTAIQKDESIDFSTVVVLGTYQQTDGVTVFTAAGLSYDFTETFSKLEKDFIVKISEEAGDAGQATKILYQRGENQSYDWSSLSAGKHNAVIELDWANHAGDYAYNFVITVVDGVSMPQFTLSEITAEIGANVKTIYCDGEPLSLWGLLVWGTYASEDTDARYSALITDYELDPPNGTILKSANNAVTEQTITVKSGDKIDTIKVTVKPIHTVTFMSDGDVKSIQSVVNGGTACESTIANLGYTFGGWYVENVTDATYDFNTTVTENITLIAKWTANTYKVTLNNDGNTSVVLDVTYDTIVPTITVPTKTGFTFGGYWSSANGQGTQYIDAAGVGSKKWDIAENTTLYAKWNVIQYNITYASIEGATNPNDTVKYTFEDEITLVAAEKVGYPFNGWYKGSTVVTQIKDSTGDITLTAQWTANTYTISFDNNDGTGDMADLDMTYDVSVDLSANSFTRERHVFIGWASSTDSDVVYADKQNVKNLSETNKAKVILYAVWRQVKVGDIMYSDKTFSPEYVADKEPIGVVFDVTTDKIKIVHLSEQSSLQWCFSGADGNRESPATSTSDGSGNWQIICEVVSDATNDDGTPSYKYPAFEYVNSLGEGWYLPAIDELNQIYTNMNVINTALNVFSSEVNVRTLGTGAYWSSSSCSSGYAWRQQFSDGSKNDYIKYLKLSVRAVRAF